MHYDSLLAIKKTRFLIKHNLKQFATVQFKIFTLFFKVIYTMENECCLKQNAKKMSNRSIHVIQSL